MNRFLQTGVHRLNPITAYLYVKLGVNMQTSDLSLQKLLNLTVGTGIHYSVLPAAYRQFTFAFIMEVHNKYSCCLPLFHYNRSRQQYDISELF